MSKRSNLVVFGILCASGACVLYVHPLFEVVHRAELLVRTDASADPPRVFSAGTLLVLPGIHSVRRS